MPGEFLLSKTVNGETYYSVHSLSERDEIVSMMEKIGHEPILNLVWKIVAYG
jgi:hypothetical protein